MANTQTLAGRAFPPQWPGALLLMLVVAVVYLPAICGGFIWDDDRMLTGNPAVKTVDGLYSIWFGNWAEDYVPLTLSSFWVEWHLWGDRPMGYHIVNVLLHAGNVVLLWRVLGKLEVPGSWLAALLFAVHPVCVESVAWISERKNVLSLFFYLLAVLWYLRRDDMTSKTGGEAGASLRHETRWYFLSLAAFFLALLAKSSVAVLPAVLLLVVWWRRDRVTKEDLDRCTPFFILAVLLGLMAVAVQSRAVHGGVGVIHDSLVVRLLGGSWALWFYLGKALAPTNLAMIYPRWQIDSGALISWVPAIFFGGLMLVFWRWRRGWGRPFFFSFTYFLLALAPALGLIDLAFFSNSRVADHLQYLALSGMAALVGAFLQKKTPWDGRLAAWVLAAVLAAMTIHREIVICDGRKLWEDTLAKNPSSWKACMNLSVILLEEGHTNEASALSMKANELLRPPRAAGN